MRWYQQAGDAWQGRSASPGSATTTVTQPRYPPPPPPHPPSTHLQGASFMEQLEQFVASDSTAAPAGASEAAAAGSAQPVLAAAQQLAKRFDPDEGGFGAAPKFPRPAEINALLCAQLELSSRGGGAGQGWAAAAAAVIASALWLVHSLHCMAPHDGQ
jgi:hypothetical protein